MAKILDFATTAYQHEDLDARIQPLVHPLRHVARSASDEVEECLTVQHQPSEQQVLGNGEFLPYKLVKISPETVSPKPNRSLAGLLLELSDSDPYQLADDVGYGYTANL